MARTIFFSSSTLIVLQLALVTASLGAIALYPPVRGRMILVPVWPGSERGLAARAVKTGARLVARGPFANSLVVSGDRAAILPVMASTGVVALSLPIGACGETT